MSYIVPKRNYETVVDSFMPHEPCRPVDRADKKITAEEYKDIQKFYREHCRVKKKYTE